MMTDWKSKLQAEFERAKAARSEGNEGQARVCARRAAGIAIREYLLRRGQSVHTASAYDLLMQLIEDPSTTPEVRQTATYLTLRVKEDFNLPVDVDLLAEAHRLCNKLLSD
jgi:HEPN domain-containing protein